MPGLSIAQILVSILLVAAILFQQRGQALGGAFGGGGEFHASRRGAEQKLYWGTILLGALWILLAVTNLLV